MAESQTIARPYAEAAFQYALEAGDLKGWSSALARIQTVLATPEAATLIGTPALSDTALATVLGDAATALDAGQQRFVELLARNGRLGALPEIVVQFENQRRAHEGIVQVHISSAFPLDDAQRKEVVDALKTRYGTRIESTVQVDPELIGGVCLRIGDEVIDASVRGKLAQLAVSLKS